MNNDTISRQAAIDAIERLVLPQTKGETMAEEINRVAWRCAINCAEEMIGHLPSAERHGRWVDRGSLSCRCRECGCKANKETAYCPNCGARMDLDEVTE